MLLRGPIFSSSVATAWRPHHPLNCIRPARPAIMACPRQLLTAAAAQAQGSPHDSSRSLHMETRTADDHRSRPVATSPSAGKAQTTPRGNDLPGTVHAKVAAQGRIIIVGDVHGCLDEFQALLKKVKFREGGNGADVVVLVGDLVNKGPHSAAVVAAARRLGALSVRGNHDDSALEAYRQHAAGQKVKDKHVWVRDLTAEDAAWMAHLPFSLRLRRALCVVHAGLVPGVQLKRQKLQNMYTMRDLIHTKSGWRASESHEGKPWAADWLGKPLARHVVFGHDAQRRLQRQKFATGIDTGCVYGGELTACIIPAAAAVPLQTRIKNAFLCLVCRSAKRPLTLRELGGTLVSVPSQQPSLK